MATNFIDIPFWFWRMTSRMELNAKLFASGDELVRGDGIRLFALMAERKPHSRPAVNFAAMYALTCPPTWTANPLRR
jgi:hypothetical protein